MLKHLRIMLEEKIEPDICKFLADRFPVLEVLEVEKCGYHDGRDVPTWVSVSVACGILLLSLLGSIVTCCITTWIMLCYFRRSAMP
jgi:hypothetical protein